MVIQEIEHRQGLSPAVVVVLSQAKLNLNGLKELINERISHKANGRSRVRQQEPHKGICYIRMISVTISDATE